jgi:molybdate transport system substrate-binding protein
MAARNKGFMMRALTLSIALLALGLSGAAPASSAEIKILTAGAFKPVVLALVPGFEKQSGHKVTVDNDTAGALTKRIEGGEAFDLVVLTPAALEQLAQKGKVAPGSSAPLARVAIGVAVKDGAPKPDISTVDAFKRALLQARAVAYIDPAAGGSSGIYLTQLFERLGIAADIKPKAVLVPGGLVATRLVSGEADLGIHQISEILAVKGATLVGPLPREIQNYTVYAAGLSAGARDPAAARALIAVFKSDTALDVLKHDGMEPPPGG